MTWESKLKSEKRITGLFYAVSVPRDKIGITTKESWNDLDPYGKLPTVTDKWPKWKRQLFGYKGGLN